MEMRRQLTLGLVVLSFCLCTSSASAEWTADKTAKVFAGLVTDACPDTPRKNKFINSYTRFINKRWTVYHNKVLSTISNWAKAELQHTPKETIFYPFSGPDFITSSRLYPNASRHVLVALQKGGKIPNLEAMSAGQTYKAIRLMTDGMKRFLKNGFFVTSRMEKHFKKGTVIQGITPVLMLFAVREGYTVEKVTPIRVNKDGTDVEVHPGDKNKRSTWDSVRLHLKRADKSSVLLDYLHVNLFNGVLKKHKNHQKWLASMAKNRVVLKAASHLMQTEHFTRIRDYLLDNATAIVQDDSGVYYKHLKKRFELQLYGGYETPNELFMQRQPKLKKAFEKQKNIKTLPFKYGYRKKAGSCIIVAHTRKAAPKK